MQYETITGAVDVGFVHKKIVGSGGEFAKVILRLEPLPDGSGLQFVNDVPDELLPTRLVLAGYPVTDLRVTLIDGTYHDTIPIDGRSVSPRAVRSGMECGKQSQKSRTGRQKHAPLHRGLSITAVA
jgi:elongation factor G